MHWARLTPSGANAESTGGFMGSAAMAAADSERQDIEAVPAAWPAWQRVLFRFFFVYLMLQIAPWRWFGAIPGVPFVLRYYRMLVDWAVYASNAHVFHVREILVRENGSGDTSYAWTQLWLYLSIALIACIVWSVLDR